MTMTVRICVNHLGFRPSDRKRAVVVATGPSDPREFEVREVGTGHIVFRGSVTYRDDPFGLAGVADFSEVRDPGLYQIRVGSTRSVPFFVRNDVFSRTAYDVFHYFHIQRCGEAIPGWHDACHLDDAKRRDTGAHVDAVGGWHDAGDLRKWMSATMWGAIAMCWVKRLWGSTWTQFSADDLLDEIKWGNAYFLKMRDPDTGQVWHDTAGGVNGDNSDNHWTDNVIGTADDRYVETRESPLIQWTFVYLQALVAQTFDKSDPEYSQRCLGACLAAYEYALKMGEDLDTLTLGMKVLAMTEVVRAGALAENTAALRGTGVRGVRSGMDGDNDGGENGGKDGTSETSETSETNETSGDSGGGASGPNAAANASASAALQAAVNAAIKQLIARQVTADGPGKGAFRAADDPNAPLFRHAWLSGVPALSLLVAHEAGFGDPSAVKQAIERYVYEYIVPLTELSAFGILPFSVWDKPATPDRYRPLPNGGVYRFFMPVLQEGDEPRPVRWWVGTTSHLLSHSLVLALAARQLEDPTLEAVALRQIEWVVGANPFQASMITGHGVNQPWPHSRFVGLIPGGIMNGIGGDVEDNPVLDQENGLSWQTNEYWSPHNAWYLMNLAVLDEEGDPAETIGIVGSRQTNR